MPGLWAANQTKSFRRELHQMQTITRAEAIAQGLSKYFTGLPCRNGHTAERYTTSGTCRECIRPASTALATISTPGEIVVREKPASLVAQQRDRLLALREKELELKGLQRQDALEIEKGKLAL